MVNELHPVAHFVADECNLSGTVAKEELFQAYGVWCEENSQRRLPNNIFSRKLLSLFTQVKSSRPQIGDDRFQFYEGIELKPKVKSNEQAEPRT